MTPEERARLRELLDAATPRPWVEVDFEVRTGPDDERVAHALLLDDAYLIVGAVNVLPGLLAALDAAEAERDRLAAAVERVRALHNRQPSRLTGDYCAADGDDYPCPTRRALDGGGE